MGQTEEFTFQNVAYWPTVYRTGSKTKITYKYFQSIFLFRRNNLFQAHETLIFLPQRTIQFAKAKRNLSSWITVCSDMLLGCILIKIRWILSRLKNWGQPWPLRVLFFKPKSTAFSTRIWHYQLWSFKTRDTKLKIFLHRNQHTQRKLLNFETLTNGEPQ